MPHRPRCCLHIGVPKTGSTALERFLLANRERLAEQGYLYSQSILRAYGHHDLAYRIAGGYPEWAIPQETSLDALLDGLRQEIADTHHCLLLSSEVFYLLCSPSAVAEALARAGLEVGQVWIVVYLRRQDEAQLSWYNQRIKAQGYTGGLQESLDECHSLWDYAARLEQWAEAFGAENLTLRPYQATDLHAADVRADFLAVLGVSADAFDFAEQPSNTALNPDLLEFQRQFNRLPLSYPEKRQFREALMELTRASAGTGLFVEDSLLDAPRRRELLAAYQAGNDALARRYLGRPRLFSEPVDAGAVSAALTPDKLAAIFGWLLARR